VKVASILPSVGAVQGDPLGFQRRERLENDKLERLHTRCGRRLRNGTELMRFQLRYVTYGLWLLIFPVAFRVPIATAQDVLPLFSSALANCACSSIKVRCDDSLVSPGAEAQTDLRSCELKLRKNTCQALALRPGTYKPSDFLPFQSFVAVSPTFPDSILAAAGTVIHELGHACSGVSGSNVWTERRALTLETEFEQAITALICRFDVTPWPVPPPFSKQGMRCYEACREMARNYVDISFGGCLERQWQRDPPANSYPNSCCSCIRETKERVKVSTGSDGNGPPISGLPSQCREFIGYFDYGLRSSFEADLDDRQKASDAHSCSYYFNSWLAKGDVSCLPTATPTPWPTEYPYPTRSFPTSTPVPTSSPTLTATFPPAIPTSPPQFPTMPPSPPGRLPTGPVSGPSGGSF
jgi:hypothetical protein